MMLEIMATNSSFDTTCSSDSGYSQVLFDFNDNDNNDNNKDGNNDNNDSKNNDNSGNNNNN